MSRPPAFGSLRFWRLLRLIVRERPSRGVVAAEDAVTALEHTLARK